MAAMICKMCGAEMNQHGEKLMYVEADGDGLGLVEQIAEAHTCPRCGHNDSRIARPVESR